MAERPLLIFPAPSETGREKKGNNIPRTHFPGVQRQIDRIEPIFSRLEDAFDSQRAHLATTLTGAIPEQAIVFETIGTIEDFINAVKLIDGLEWLAEWEQNFDPDDDFYIVDEGEPTDKKLGGRLFLIMSDQRAITELRSLWERYKNGDGLPRGKGRFKGLFTQLKNIRLWDISDRFRGTGLELDWKDKMEQGEERIRFEVELWFRSSADKRREVVSEIRTLLQNVSGAIITETAIQHISYHALLIEARIEIFHDLSQNSNVQLLRADSVMFFRPVGQAIIQLPNGEPELDGSIDNESVEIIQEPIVALFDGVPLSNHMMLKERIIIDDPDDFESRYQAHERIHGTTMASLIIHGEIDRSETSLNRSVYVHPILTPLRGFRDTIHECIPDNILPVDIIHRAVRRMFEGEGEMGPTAPKVKIINLSIGDAARPFDFSVSPWARLLDWLSYKYRVLFIVSTGNYVGDINLNMPTSEVRGLTAEDLSAEVVKSIHSTSHDRRLLSPSEAINCITVGALHDDSSTIAYLGFRKELISHLPMVSPMSRFGLGYRRSIKPEIVMSGGRQLYLEGIGNEHYKLTATLMAPGHKVAYPKKEGDLNSFAYTRGTSNAAALATRTAAIIYDSLKEQFDTEGTTFELIEANVAVLIKALLVHGASWNTIYSSLEQLLGQDRRERFKDRVVPRLVGYGLVDAYKVYECTEQRATLFGVNTLTKEKAHIYSVPLPPSLSSKTIKRRLTITLAWFSPINSNDQKYRQGQLWFDPPAEELALKRVEADWTAVRRGTVQHEILEGDRAMPFVDGDMLQIKVNCREEAGKLNVEVPYALAVSLEVAEGVEIPIYNEVRERIRPRVEVLPNNH
ncbi:S8 family peptidase [Paenibacillus radicis (ex Gao et al. 2016)]|uniref:Peptidase S8/S53 domain-containing protein n=1 Tax=Paenibacillus radicis (ex Gao et al. 2016) TaxID=1737354 RepID=A0A917M1D9_9BACL|nr:S8 family peptidase [Paenibacillus radicis (ex Gao et al. 2016)]GGG71680.1 hypothetical protein GCM10010918_29110 [Paenibacillus radicis (ex Gao et al. 2016)]